MAGGAYTSGVTTRGRPLVGGRSTDLGLLSDYEKRGLNPERLAAAVEHAGASVLDVGCAGGAYLDRLGPDRCCVGIDRVMFPAWSRSSADYLVGDAANLPFADGAFESVLLFETLEHLVDPGRALVEYLRVCSRNLILTVPNCALTPGLRQSGLIANHWIDRSHVNFYDLDSISAAVIAAGFVVREARLINRIDLFPLIGESFRLSQGVTRAMGRVLRRLQRPYRMTSLIVAERSDPPE